jgi:Bacterial capsule synthesis protein PGA_cap
MLVNLALHTAAQWLRGGVRGANTARVNVARRFTERRRVMARARVALVAGALAAAPLPPGRPLTLVWGGDVTLGSSYGLPPRHARGMLAGVVPTLRAADIAAVNLEGTLGSGGVPKCPPPPRAAPNCFAFQAPAANAGALRRAGVDIVNLANNHTMDFGPAGMRQTVMALRRRRVAYTGRRGEIRYLSLPGARVAFLGFSAYPWTSPIRDLEAVRRLIARAARHANVVVAFMHAGAEGIGHTHTPNRDEQAFGELRGNPRAFAHAAIDAGADLVLGSGPHVLRGMEIYRRRLIAYSLGNLAGYRNFARGGLLSVSGLLSAGIGADGVLAGGRLMPLELVGPGLPVPDPARAAAGLVARLSRADFGSRAVHLSPSGRIVVAE